jgi:hypothetical protein
LLPDEDRHQDGYCQKCCPKTYMHKSHDDWERWFERNEKDRRGLPVSN